MKGSNILENQTGWGSQSCPTLVEPWEPMFILFYHYFRFALYDTCCAVSIFVSLLLHCVVLACLLAAHSAVDKLKSDAQVSIPVEVKFVNRSRREVQLDWVTTQGRREKKKVLPRGRCWRTTSWEGHYWVCCDPKQSDRMFVLNFGRYYRVQKSRRPRERVVITAGW